MQEKRCFVVAMSVLVLAGLFWGSGCGIMTGMTLDDETIDEMNDVMDDMMNTSNLAVFIDPGDMMFSTSDVRDLDGEIVRIDLDTDSIIWVADGTSHGAGTWTVSGNFLTETSFFEVVFGSEGGERRAYFTETSTGTLCDISLFDGDIRVVQTSVPVPQD
jgi:major membrane immunogen (membrane-anchored lipoprotein)